MSIASAENGWINTRDSQHPAILERAHRILTQTIYCSISTCSQEGVPWASPVFFTYDSSWNLYWSSTISAQHSQNIYLNQGRAAIAVYGTEAGEGKGQGLYFQGIAKELAPERVNSVMQSLFKRAGGEPPQRTASDYLGKSPRRMYGFAPSNVWITGDRVPVGNQLVDTKIQLHPSDLVDFTSRESDS
jgi:uncharacterized protein YhbP (UPF0306 family)